LAFLASLGSKASGAFVQPAGWLARNGWNIAKVAIPTIGGIAGGLALDQAIRPTTTQNTGGAPIINNTTPSTGTDPLSSMMNMLPTMMMMMMMLPMMKNMSSAASNSDNKSNN